VTEFLAEKAFCCINVNRYFDICGVGQVVFAE